MDSIRRADLEALDQADALAPLRHLFSLPQGVIYLDGNSLGPPPRAAAARIAEVVQQEWGEGLIRSWNDAGWIDLAARIARKISRLIGVAEGSVMVGDSTSVNLFKALGAALSLRPERRVILSERSNFPTDLYVAQGLTRLLDRGHQLRLVDAEELPEAINADVAVVMLTHVNYRTGAMHDMAGITSATHSVGAIMVWDLAHSAGAMPLDLAGADADMAVGCGYKFLNGGPGAPAFLHVAPRLHDDVTFPVTGWLGHAAPFAFESSYRPSSGINAAVVGTPPIISLAALEVGVDIALEADLDLVRAKSLHQSELFISLIGQTCGRYGFTVVSPSDKSRRGSQVSLSHPHAYPIMQALIARGVIGDFRTPDILRFGITPLYLGYAELFDAVTILRDVMDSGAWRNPEYERRRAVM